MIELAGKNVLVTAAAQGIGRAAAEACLSAGASVTATDLSIAALADLAALGVAIERLDVTDAAAVQAVAGTRTWDAVIHCAGCVHDGTVLDVDDATFDFAINLNLRSAFHISRAVLPGMRSAGIGSLVYISSVASSIKGVPRRSVYGATKAGLIGLAKSVAADFVTEGIRANCICPGTVDTPSLQQRIEAKGDDFDAIRAAFVARQPMGRLGTAQEIGALARFLCSPAASFITGQAIAIDGGWTI
jgi:2-keto-3-deoxy-L-fuconate dehydrogenase